MTQLSQHNSIHLQVVWIQCWFDFAYITHLAFRLEVLRSLYTCLMLTHVPIGRRLPALPHKNRLSTCCTSRWRSERCSSHTCNYPALSGSHDSDYPDHYPEPVTATPARYWQQASWPVRHCPERWLARSASIWYSLCALSSDDSCLWRNVGAGNY